MSRAGHKRCRPQAVSATDDLAGERVGRGAVATTLSRAPLPVMRAACRSVGRARLGQRLACRAAGTCMWRCWRRARWRRAVLRDLGAVLAPGSAARSRGGAPFRTSCRRTATCPQCGSPATMMSAEGSCATAHGIPHANRPSAARRGASGRCTAQSGLHLCTSRAIAAHGPHLGAHGPRLGGPRLGRTALACGARP